PLSRTETVVLTALLAFHPAVLASSLNVNLDIGVLAFFLLYTLALVRGRFGLAALAGVGLVLSKETGALLLPLSAAALLRVAPGRRRTAWLTRAARGLVIPAGLYVAYLLYKTLVMAAILLGLFAPSLEHTVDPLSRRLVGTFDFGRHP